MGLIRIVLLTLAWCAMPGVSFAAVDGCYLMENNTDLYLMENNSDTYLIEGDDGGACGGVGGSSVPSRLSLFGVG
jgi:hypothetical protein